MDGSQRYSALELPPTIILGGFENALSIARSLGSRGVEVWVLAKPEWPVRQSRFAKWIPLPDYEDFWEACVEFLTGADSGYLEGSVLLAASDEAISIITDHRPLLQSKFRLDHSNPAAQNILLDKITTYQAARAAGVPTPRFWVLRDRDDLSGIVDELVFPLIIKPRLSHQFWPLFKGAKYINADSIVDVERALDVVFAAGVETFLVEKIPGPDDLLCSYYTYIDDHGRHSFDFTKRVIRRHPKNMGLGTYHITDPIPEIHDRSLRLFQSVGLRGIANVEYKQDPRDGEYKIIECNCRFTGATSLLARSGLDLADYVYRHVVGLPAPQSLKFKKGVRLLDPVRDFAAYRELRALGELTLFEWLQSVLRIQTFVWFSWHDPVPFFARMKSLIKRNIEKLSAAGRLQRSVHRTASVKENQ